MSSGRWSAGTPTRVLAAFDPATTPPSMANGMSSLTTRQVFDQFVSTTDALLDSVAGLTDEQWTTVAESPAGHVPIRLLVQHALWDSWVHERDVAIPLGITAAIENDELQSCLQYAAAIGPVLGSGLRSLPQRDRRRTDRGAQPAGTDARNNTDRMDQPRRRVGDRLRFRLSPAGVAHSDRCSVLVGVCGSGRHRSRCAASVSGPWRPDRWYGAASCPPAPGRARCEYPQCRNRARPVGWSVRRCAGAGTTHEWASRRSARSCPCWNRSRGRTNRLEGSRTGFPPGRRTVDLPRLGRRCGCRSCIGIASACDDHTPCPQGRPTGC